MSSSTFRGREAVGAINDPGSTANVQGVHTDAAHTAGPEGSRVASGGGGYVVQERAGGDLNTDPQAQGRGAVAGAAIKGRVGIGDSVDGGTNESGYQDPNMVMGAKTSEARARTANVRGDYATAESIKEDPQAAGAAAGENQASAQIAGHTPARVTEVRGDARVAGDAYANPQGTAEGAAKQKVEAKLAESRTAGDADAHVQGNVTVSTTDPEKK